MENSRLVELCLSFGPYELREVRKFLRSPYFNQRDDVQQLFELILERKGKLSAEEAFVQLFADTTFDIQQLRFVMSWLMKRLEKYLIVKQLLDDKIDCQMRLSRVYREKELNRHAASSQKQTQELLQKSPFRSSRFHYFEHDIIHEQNLLASKQHRTATLNLQAQSDALDVYFLITKLKEACELLSHQAVVKNTYDLGLLQALLPSIKSDWLTRHPALAIFLECFHMLRNPNQPSHFLILRQKMKDAAHLLLPDERRDVYLFAINFSIRRYNDGDADFGSEAFTIYQTVLQEGLLTLDGYLSRFAYRNIVALGLQLQQFDWVAGFLETYRPQLAPNHQLATYSFNLAKLEYARGNLDAVIVALQKADYRDVLLNLAAKTLLVKVYYEQQALQALDSHLAAMRRFVRRKKMLAYHRDNYLHFVQAMRQLSRLNPYDRAASQKLRSELENLHPLTERKWLLTQLPS